MTKNQRHHTWPRKWRNRQNGTTEIKMVNGKAHRLFHQLVSDMHPIDAIQYLVENFLPSNITVEVRYK